MFLSLPPFCHIFSVTFICFPHHTSPHILKMAECSYVFPVSCIAFSPSIGNWMLFVC
jgi:hypothetical protein